MFPFKRAAEPGLSLSRRLNSGSPRSPDSVGSPSGASAAGSSSARDFTEDLVGSRARSSTPVAESAASNSGGAVSAGSADKVEGDFANRSGGGSRRRVGVSVGGTVGGGVTSDAMLASPPRRDSEIEAHAEMVAMAASAMGIESAAASETESVERIGSSRLSAQRDIARTRESARITQTASPLQTPSSPLQTSSRGATLRTSPSTAAAAAAPFNNTITADTERAGAPANNTSTTPSTINAYEGGSENGVEDGVALDIYHADSLDEAEDAFGRPLTPERKEAERARRVREKNREQARSSHTVKAAATSLAASGRGRGTGSEQSVTLALGAVTSRLEAAFTVGPVRAFTACVCNLFVTSLLLSAALVPWVSISTPLNPSTSSPQTLMTSYGVLMTKYMTLDNSGNYASICASLPRARDGRASSKAAGMPYPRSVSHPQSPSPPRQHTLR